MLLHRSEVLAALPVCRVRPPSPTPPHPYVPACQHGLSRMCTTDAILCAVWLDGRSAQGGVQHQQVALEPGQRDCGSDCSTETHSLPRLKADVSTRARARTQTPAHVHALMHDRYFLGDSIGGNAKTLMVLLLVLYRRVRKNAKIQPFQRYTW